jgi:hypothetical protein
MSAEMKRQLTGIIQTAETFPTGSPGSFGVAALVYTFSCVAVFILMTGAPWKKWEIGRFTTTAMLSSTG